MYVNITSILLLKDSGRYVLLRPVSNHRRGHQMLHSVLCFAHGPSSYSQVLERSRTDRYTYLAFCIDWTENPPCLTHRIYISASEPASIEDLQTLKSSSLNHTI